MARYFYDLHLHSCLSPCGDDDMTPYNAMQMAALNELDIVALTDHNTAKNCPAASLVADRCGLCFVPGMELCTREEIHVVCLFPTLCDAMDFDAYVEKKLLPIPNDPSVFGRQRILNDRDECLGEFDRLLVTAAEIGVDEVPALVGRFHGAAVPAHIDRTSYSLLSALGDFPESIGFQSAEISSRGDTAALKSRYPVLQRMPLLLSSDAHYLEDIHPRRAWLELEERSPEAVIRALNGGACGFGRG